MTLKDIKYPDRIELELTLQCNRACPTCNRHCNVYDRMEDSGMSMGQIKRFISQVEAKGKHWDIVAVMGGEPTIHPQFNDVMLLLWNELVGRGHVEQLQIWTNGMVPIDLGELPVRYLAQEEPSVPDGSIHIVTADHAKKMHYQAFLAPIDTGQLRCMCKSLSVCGFSLSAYGYAPCGPGGAIARLYGLGYIARSELPGNAGEWGNDLFALCDRCQYSAVTRIPLLAMWGEKPRREISPDYQKAMDAYNKNPRFGKW